MDRLFRLHQEECLWDLVVLMGHRNAEFSALGSLSIGERVAVDFSDGRHLVYGVTGVQVVPAGDADLEVDVPGEQLALVTCWPVHGRSPSPLRLVVRASRQVEDGEFRRPG